ncbi:signal transduction histidine kinase [Haloactinospora alba]|uniref:histidine kinase n=2 Tax=Haloactinospora alba TaxID=405555 RepID=A0A543NJ30_9ACTN|nr:signal transduction histidine kinase [Haloactinospora alba]
MWGRWWGRRHRIVDWVAACAYFPFVALFNFPSPSGVLSYLVQGAPPGIPTQLVMIVLFGIALPGLVSWAILLRRRNPGPLLVLAAVLMVATANFVPSVIALYSYAAWYSDARRLSGWTGVLAALFVVFYGIGPSNTAAGAALFIVFMGTLTIALPLVAGLWVGTRRQLIANLQERAQRLEREQHLMANRAIVAERTRIAREMHDVVAHRVSMMVLHAGGLEISASDRATADTASLIRSTGREALSELRGILGVLRDENSTEAPTAPQPVLDDIERLLDEWRAAGMSVEKQVTGTPCSFAAQVERTAYRVVQEALTNAGKHAPGAPVAVRLDYGSEDLEIVVSNEPSAGEGSGRGSPPPSSGFGLTGLRERVALVGGTLAAGADPDGGWRIRAVLPAAPAADQDTTTSNDDGGE